MLITFEGIDGCGKSTQAKLLSEHLQSRGITTLLLREPGGTALSEQIRHILLEQTHADGVSAISELFLFSAARAQLVASVVKPALRRGTVVICDRYTDSTIAYQAYGRGLPLGQVELLNEMATDSLSPDLTFLIDIPLDTGIARRHGMGDDRMESESRLFFHRVITGYLAQAQKYPERIHVIDGTDPLESIQHTITRLVEYELGNELRQAKDDESERQDTRNAFGSDQPSGDVRASDFRAQTELEGELAA